MLVPGILIFFIQICCRDSKQTLILDIPTYFISVYLLILETIDFGQPSTRKIFIFILNCNICKEKHCMLHLFFLIIYSWKRNLIFNLYWFPIYFVKLSILNGPVHENPFQGSKSKEFAKKYCLSFFLFNNSWNSEYSYILSAFQDRLA